MMTEHCENFKIFRIDFYWPKFDRQRKEKEGYASICFTNENNLEQSRSKMNHMRH